MSLAIVHIWKPNPLAPFVKKMMARPRENNIFCRMFTPMAVVLLYGAPEHRWTTQDDIAQWEDDGGR